MMDSVSDFEEMIANTYTVFVGTRKSIQIMKRAFDNANVPMCNMAFYPVRSSKHTDGVLLPLTDLKLKVEALRNLHIL